MITNDDAARLKRLWERCEGSHLNQHQFDVLWLLARLEATEKRIEVRERQLRLAASTIGHRESPVFVVLSGNRIADVMMAGIGGSSPFVPIMELVPLEELEAMLAARESGATGEKP